MYSVSKQRHSVVVLCKTTAKYIQPIRHKDVFSAYHHQQQRAAGMVFITGKDRVTYVNSNMPATTEYT